MFASGCNNFQWHAQPSSAGCCPWNRWLKLYLKASRIKRRGKAIILELAPSLRKY